MSTLSTRTNPYASPTATQRVKTTESATRLFSAQQVGIASFFGSSLAGMTLVAINHFRLGKPVNGILSMLIGAIIVGAVITASILMPLPGLIYGFAQFGITLGIAKAEFGKQYEANEAKNVGNASGWTVAGVTAAWTVVLVLAIFGVLSLA